MDRDVIVSRQWVATIVILACGLVPDRLYGDGPSRIRNLLKSNLFNRADLERIDRGYYEQLLSAGRRLDDLADVPRLRVRRRSGTTWSIPVEDGPLVTRVDDLREVVLKRDNTTERFGLQWRTNAQGMRDQSYSTAKPAGTFRIALVGDSIAAGWGVNAEQRFESILEQTWHARAKQASGLTVEIINCAVPGHSPGQRWYHFSQVGWPMGPDLVICESTAADVGWDERRLRFLLARGLGWDSPIYHGALVKAGVEPFGSPDDYKRALRPRHWDILAGVYETMAADCRTRGVPILWILVPRVGRKHDGADQRTLLMTARAAGFSRVIDVTDAYDDIDPSRLAIDTDDFHPNASGHARLAGRLDRALRDLPELASLWKPSPDQVHGENLARAQDVLSDHGRGNVETAVPQTSPGGEPR
jgi:lysophospholipase L1-like esterase